VFGSELLQPVAFVTAMWGALFAPSSQLSRCPRPPPPDGLRSPGHDRAAKWCGTALSGGTSCRSTAGSRPVGAAAIAGIPLVSIPVSNLPPSCPADAAIAGHGGRSGSIACWAGGLLASPGSISDGGCCPTADSAAVIAGIVLTAMARSR